MSGTAPTAGSATGELPTKWFYRAAGTYDLVSLGGGRCARKIVALAAGNWTLADCDGTDNGPFAVFQGYTHIGTSRNLVTDQPVMIFY